MNFAVNYLPVGDSTVFAWDDKTEVKKITLESGKLPNIKSNIFQAGSTKKKKMPTSMSKADFLAQLAEGDLVYTELGGQNDRFCIAVANRKSKLLRLPTGVISDEQKRQRQGGASGEEVESSASILHRFALSQPEKFYPFRPIEDLRYLEVRLLSRSYWTIQRDIRIATANRLRHLQQDLDLIGGLEAVPMIKGAIDAVLETLPSQEEVEVDIDPKVGVAVKFYKSLERKISGALEAKLKEMPMYNAVFAPIPGCGPGISGYIISQVIDIRRFPTFGKFRAFAGYHLMKSSNGRNVAPRPMKGQRANWDHVLQQAVYYFTAVIDKQKPTNPWKAQLQTRYRYEIGKLLEKAREDGKPVPQEMSTEKFISMVQNLREEAEANEKIAKLPEPYKGIPVVARKRALRWLGQKFLQYVYVEWRRFEGITDEETSNSVSA